MVQSQARGESWRGGGEEGKEGAGRKLCSEDENGGRDHKPGDDGNSDSRTGANYGR